MLIIDCPYCGPREETEYHYGGQAHVAYPEDPSALSDAEWARYLFYRDNPRGRMAERWVHSGGCRMWFNAIRDTLTYEITHVYKAGEPCPDPSVLTAPGAIGPQPGDAAFDDDAVQDDPAKESAR